MTDFASKWPPHLVVVRHAESQRNIWKEIAIAKGEFVYGGEVRDMDVELTETGKKQAVLTGQVIGKKFTFDRVFASPFTRTMQTAQLLVRQFPYEVEITEEERLARRVAQLLCQAQTASGSAYFPSSGRGGCSIVNVPISSP